MATPRSTPNAPSSSSERSERNERSERGVVPESGPLSTKHALCASDLLDQALEVLTHYVSVPTARSILNLAQQRKGGSEGDADLSHLLESIGHGLRLFVTDPAQVRKCCASLEALADAQPKASVAVIVPIHTDDDIANARLEGRRAAASAGFSTVGVTRLMTAISEVARSIVLYAGQGQIDILPSASPRGIEIVARDRGPGIVNLDQILAGNYTSRLGMGLGLRGVKRLSDQFEVQTAPGRGTVVRFVMRVT